jgi:hypothetical protein
MVCASAAAAQEEEEQREPLAVPAQPVWPFGRGNYPAVYLDRPLTTPQGMVELGIAPLQASYSTQSNIVKLGGGLGARVGILHRWEMGIDGNVISALLRSGNSASTTFGFVRLSTRVLAVRNGTVQLAPELAAEAMLGPQVTDMRNDTFTNVSTFRFSWLQQWFFSFGLDLRIRVHSRVAVRFGDTLLTLLMPAHSTLLSNTVGLRFAPAVEVQVLEQLALAPSVLLFQIGWPSKTEAQRQLERDFGVVPTSFPTGPQGTAFGFNLRAIITVGWRWDGVIDFGMSPLLGAPLVLTAQTGLRIRL